MGSSLSIIGGTLEETGNSLVDVCLEMIRIFPDGLVLVVGLFSLVTLSVPYGTFFLVLLESVGIFTILNSFNIVEPLPITGSVDPKDRSDKCTSGYRNKFMDIFSILGKNQSLSSSLFILSVATSYIVTTLFSLKTELETFGKNFVTRFYYSIIGLPLFVLMFILFNMTYKCFSLASITLSVFLGLVTGILLCALHLKIFGKEAINIIGIPLLYEKTADGSPLYICQK
jgi:hypothetical protein